MPVYANARAFLVAAEQRYRSLSDYADTGLCRSFMLPGVHECAFQTFYRRPGMLRFAFSSPHPYRPLKRRVANYIVGSDGAAAYFYSRSYAGEESVEQPESLERAVAGATGISGGAAHTIGALLFPEVGGFKLLDMRRIRFRRNKVVGGVPCVAVSGLHPGSGRVTAWFGAEDLLLRRLVRGRITSEEVRFIEAGSPAPEEVFRVPTLGT